MQENEKIMKTNKQTEEKQQQPANPKLSSNFCGGEGGGGSVEGGGGGSLGGAGVSLERHSFLHRQFRGSPGWLSHKVTKVFTMWKHLVM